VSWSKGSPDEKSIKTSEYESLGNFIRDSSYGLVQECDYDKNSREVRRRYIDAKDTSYTLTNYSNDLLQDTTLWLRNGKIESRRISKRDEAGRTIVTIDEDYASNNVTSQEKNYSDSVIIEKGNIVSSSGINKGSWSRRFTPNGYPIEEIQLDASNNITLRITTAFDHDGNIILYDYFQIRDNNHWIDKWSYEYYK
jgi:hypothetical protein